MRLMHSSSSTWTMLSSWELRLVSSSKLQQLSWLRRRLVLRMQRCRQLLTYGATTLERCSYWGRTRRPGQ